MTVSAGVPIAEYNGNGTVTRFDWDWDMGPDSVIGVLVDNEIVTNYREEGQSIIFDTAPDDGAFIQIYRRTPVVQSEDYRTFGRFHPDKTELTMDRAALVAQERLGDAIPGEEPNGIVGGANLAISRQSYSITVHSERGSDAVVPMWVPDDIVTPDPDPDATIVWAGSDIQARIVEDTTQNSNIRFRMDLTGGEPTEASAIYEYDREILYASWVDVDPADSEYWMRVTETGTPNEKIVISDGLALRSVGEEFPMRDDGAGYGPYISVSTFGDTAPSTQVVECAVEICKDDGAGSPDGAWVSRNVRLEARLYA